MLKRNNFFHLYVYSQSYFCFWGNNSSIPISGASKAIVNSNPLTTVLPWYRVRATYLKGYRYLFDNDSCSSHSCAVYLSLLFLQKLWQLIRNSNPVIQQQLFCDTIDARYQLKLHTVNIKAKLNFFEAYVQSILQYNSKYEPPPESLKIVLIFFNRSCFTRSWV